MTRRRFEWRLKGRTLLLGERTLLMAVLNVTPDSFSDGGRYFDPDRAFARALELEDQGADIIDIGAESTRPGSERVSEAEETRRLIPVLKRLEGKLSIPLSVDTYKSAVAAKAIEYGVEIINDPSNLTFDPDVAKIVAHADAGLILNHMRGTPETWAKLPPMKDAIGGILHDLEAGIHRAVSSGVDHLRMVIDPGLGFGKRREQNAEILARLSQLGALELPVMVGPSRKSFLGTNLGTKPDESDMEFATAAAVTAAVLGGAHIVRIHDVLKMKPVLQIADAVLAASIAPEPVVAKPPPLPRRRF